MMNKTSKKLSYFPTLKQFEVEIWIMAKLSSSIHTECLQLFGQLVTYKLTARNAVLLTMPNTN